MSDNSNSITEAGSVAIWNPKASAILSLVLSPAFGTYLHMLNWKVLGDSTKASVSKIWFYISIVVMIVCSILRILVADRRFPDGTPDHIFRAAIGLVYILYICSWYYSSAQAQVQYVKAKYGTSYIHKRWGKPLLYYAVLMLAYFIVLSIVIGAIHPATIDKNVLTAPK